jgi:MFS transporter, MHS family, proline/betaine transporter
MSGTMVGPSTDMNARRAITAAGIGNVLEYYDFGIYGFLASVIGRKFFPGTDEAAGLLAIFAAFGVKFLAARSAESCWAGLAISAAVNQRWC